MKQVSFKVARALKDAGYPQGESYASYLENIEGEGYLMDKDSYDYSAPTYFEVWIWLWKVKKIAIPADYFGYENNYWESCVPIGNDKFEFFSSKEGPEEVIEKAIEHLVDNDLIR